MRSPIPLILTLLCAIGLASAQDIPAGRWSGWVYTDYSYNVGRDTGINALANKALTGAKDMNAFQIRRIYMTYDADVAASFAMRFRLEVDEASNASSGKIGSFVKDAYLKWKGVFGGTDLIAGIQPTPAFEISESIWGYKSLEKTILDLRSIVSSRDQGVSLRGALLAEGKANYWVMMANGSGNTPETDRYKRYYGHVEVRPITNVVATVYADYAARLPISTTSGKLSNNALTTAAFVGYKVKDQFSVGVEGFMRSLDHGFLSSGSYLTQSTFGISAFGSYVLQPSISVIARFDSYDPNTNAAAKGDVRNYVLAGVSWTPEKNVSIIPNIQMEMFETPVSGIAIDPSLTARVTLTYWF